MSNKSEAPDTFSLIHLSDLHCSDGQLHLFCPSHKHDEAMMQGAEHHLRLLSKSTDRVLITGDLTNYGDPESLRFAKMWLTGRVGLSGGRTTGLKLSPTKLRIIPGNHDAWDNDRTGTLAMRLQRAIRNFNNEFPDHQMPASGVHYDWIEKGGHGVYLAFVNSCHLGDEEEYKDSDRVGITDRVAKGRVTLNQSEEILTLHEMGLRGRLETPGISGTYISPDKYARSLKFLVMHHYLFPPPGVKKQATLDLKQATRVFRNLAYSDFDVLLCGHKHFSKTCFHKYGQHFDKRARHRYAWNCFRSQVGLSAMPDQYSDDKGSWWNRKASDAINLVLSAFASATNGVVLVDHLDELCRTLKAALENPAELEDIILTYAKRTRFVQSPVINSDELRELKRRLRVEFTKEQRAALKPICDDILRKVKRIDKRDFIQVICGSTTKAMGARLQYDQENNRSFNHYRCAFNGVKWELTKEEYEWRHETNAFIGPIGHPSVVFDRG